MKIKIAVLVFVFSAGMAFGQSSSGDEAEKKGSESELASLAKKEAERRQALPEQGVVITNVELSELIGYMRSSKAPASNITPVDPDGNDNGEADGTPPNTAAEEKDALLEELRDELRDARQNVESASNSYMVLELRINYLRNRLYQEADPQQQQMLQRELNLATTDISEVRAEEAEARQELDQIKKEAQSAGMLPGEIRSIVGTIPVTRSSATID